MLLREFDILPDDQQMKFRELWDEFEAEETPEARFAHTLDNFQPVMLNATTDGKAWDERNIKLEQILRRNRNTSCGSDKLWQYSYENFIQPNVKKGRIKVD